MTEIEDMAEEVTFLRREGSRRGWWCAHCRYWMEPYVESSADRVVLSKPCDRCTDGCSTFAVTQDWVRATDAEQRLKGLRQELANEILRNTSDGDDCAYCVAYRHSAAIVLGEAVAEPPGPAEGGA